MEILTKNKLAEYDGKVKEVIHVVDTKIDDHKSATEDAHAIGAITGLQASLNKKVDKTTFDDVMIGLNNRLATSAWYGYEFDRTVTDPAVNRIGDLGMHKATGLPIQNRIKGCLIDGTTGEVNEYLNPTNWEASNLDGSDGQVMAEIPEYYVKFEYDGNIYRAKFSEFALPGFTKVSKVFVSAYEASLNRDTLMLSSVVNNSETYRGGNNNADWDDTYRSLLGRPATSISRINFTKYARNRNPLTTEWNQYLYQSHKSLYHLFILEYATRNSQAAFTSELTSEGYKQGGLGNGVTTVSSSIWSDKFSYNPFIPCGATNSLGNFTGEVNHSTYDENSELLWTQPANRYRAIELPFGANWKWMADLNVNRTATESQVYTCSDPANFSDTGIENYDFIGLEARENGYVKEIIGGDTGDIMPLEVGGGSTTNFCDYHYTSESAGIRGVHFGGAAIHGAYAGFAFAYSYYSPATADAILGARLCFLPKY